MSPRLAAIVRANGQKLQALLNYFFGKGACTVWMKMHVQPRPFMQGMEGGSQSQICFYGLVVAVVDVVRKTHCSSIRRMNKAQIGTLNIQTLGSIILVTVSVTGGPK